MPSIHHLQERDLATYLETDRIATLINANERPGDDAFASHRWLTDSAPKRMIFDRMYGELLSEDCPRLRVLDVGGGITALSRILVRRHDYHLIDIFAHEDEQSLDRFASELGRTFWTQGDWYANWPSETYDIVIANDLFPNVDQRLVQFLEHALPMCGRLRMSLTFYNTPRHYLVRRIDGGEEILCVQAYDGERTSAALSKFRDRISLTHLDEFLSADGPSLFANGRQIAVATFQGEAKMKLRVGG